MRRLDESPTVPRLLTRRGERERSELVTACTKWSRMCFPLTVAALRGRSGLPWVLGFPLTVAALRGRSRAQPGACGGRSARRISPPPRCSARVRTRDTRLVARVLCGPRDARLGRAQGFGRASLPWAAMVAGLAFLATAVATVFAQA